MSILPAHTQPFEDELLSSWMVRLAFQNGYSLHTFYSKVLGLQNLPIWTRDVDRGYSYELLAALAESIGRPIGFLNRNTLRHYEGRLFERLPVNGRCHWIIHPGIYHRKHKRAGNQFCPLCLRLDPVPYYRRHWRLALYTVCEKHRCFLVDRCPKCNEPVCYHRLGIKTKDVPETSITCCFNCGFDFEDFVPQWPDSVPKSYLSIMAGLKRRPGFFLGSDYVASALFFSGLWQIASVIIGKNSCRLRIYFLNKFGLELPFRDKNVRQIHDLRVKERFKLLVLSINLLDDWPNVFVRTFQKCRFTKSRFSDYLPDMPYWLRDAVLKELTAKEIYNLQGM